MLVYFFNCYIRMIIVLGIFMPKQIMNELLWGHYR
jgi:hypothetical protein